MTQHNSSTPEVVFGTGILGMDYVKYKTADTVGELLALLTSLGIKRVDTGARYPPHARGLAESLLGENHALLTQFVVDTKVYTKGTDREGELSPENIKNGMLESLERLGLERVNVYYAHAPDPRTPVELQIREFCEQIKLGRCKEYGLSNYSVEEMEEWLRVCEEKKLRKPAVFQGGYNIVTRAVEKDLLPLLRKHGIKYMAFRPLGSGFLTGNAVNGTTKGTRFEEPGLGPIYQKLFGAEDLQAAMKTFLVRLKEHDITPVDAALRWLIHHSALGEGDGIILGASKDIQIEESVKASRGGPLPADVVRLIDELWNELKETRVQQA